MSTRSPIIIPQPSSQQRRRARPATGPHREGGQAVRLTLYYITYSLFPLLINCHHHHYIYYALCMIVHVGEVGGAIQTVSSSGYSGLAFWQGVLAILIYICTPCLRLFLNFPIVSRSPHLCSPYCCLLVMPSTHLWWKESSFLSSLCRRVQLSDPYSTMDSTHAW